MTPTFSAALLAGGRSTRMGRDKALLPLPGGELLWQRQLRVLGQLRPHALLWSGPPRPGLPAHVRIVPDAVRDAGPLGGISACLDVLETDLLVVLAVDLPHMTTDFLHRLLERCTAERGAVTRSDGFYEPLAAVYPRGLRALAAGHLREGRRTLQELAHAAVARQLVREEPLEPHDAPLFLNANTPQELP